MERLAEQGGADAPPKFLVLPGTGTFTAGDICNYLKDGSYYFPFIIYREQIKTITTSPWRTVGLRIPAN